MTFLDILKTLGPAILAVVPGAQPFIPLVVAGIAIAEETGKPGADKRAIALESVSLAAQTANTIAKKEVMNPSEAVQVADDTIDSIVGVVNLVKKVADKDSDK